MTNKWSQDAYKPEQDAAREALKEWKQPEGMLRRLQAIRWLAEHRGLSRSDAEVVLDTTPHTKIDTDVVMNLWREEDLTGEEQ